MPKEMKINLYGYDFFAMPIVFPRKVFYNDAEIIVENIPPPRLYEGSLSARILEEHTYRR